MSFYGYIPADYNKKLDFIGDAIKEMGTAVSYVPEIVKARDRMKHDVKIVDDTIADVENNADWMSRDKSMQKAYMSLHAATNRNDFVSTIVDSDVPGYERGEDGLVYRVNPESGEREQVDYVNNEEVQNDIIAGALKRDIVRTLPKHTVERRKSGRLKSVQEASDWYNEYTQNTNGLFRPLLETGEIEVSTLLSALNAPTGPDKGMGIDGLSQAITNKRNSDRDAKLYTDSTNKKANQITMPAVDGKTDFKANVSITPTEFNKMVRDGKYNQSTDNFKNTAAEVVSNYDNTFGSAVNEYIANSIASVGLDSLLSHMEKGTAAKKGAAIDVLAFDASVTDEIANKINPAVISSLEGFQEMSPEAQKQVLDNFDATVDMYAKSAIQLLTITDPNELRGSGGGSKPGIQLIKQGIDIANQRYGRNLDRIDQLKAEKKLDGKQQAELNSLQKENVALLDKIDNWQKSGIPAETLMDVSKVPEIATEERADEMIRVATNKFEDLNQLAVLEDMTPEELQVWFATDVSPDYRVTSLGPDKGYTFTDSDGAPVMRGGQPLVLGAKKDVGDVRAGKKGLTPEERKTVAKQERTQAEQKAVARKKIVDVAARVINKNFNAAVYSKLPEKELIEKLKEDNPQLEDRDDQFILDAYEEARFQRDPSLRENTFERAAEAAGYEYRHRR